MSAAAAPVEEIAAAEPGRFPGALSGRGEPAVVRGLAADWPATRAGREGDARLAAYLRPLDGGAPVETFVAPAAIDGCFFYNDALDGFNFARRRATLGQVLDALIAGTGDPQAEALYAGAAPAPRHMPGFAEANALAGLPAGAVPRLWLGNRVTVRTHYDASDNLACVVAGRRRFTLFPPDQVANLYPGPLEFTPAGQPVSMASPDAPDFARHPRFAEALRHARTAELGPGDAIYVPALWWHHVRSLAPVNLLVNYWWPALPPAVGAPMEALAHAILTVRHLPPAQRAAWRAMFDHLVFAGPGPADAHLPAAAKGGLAPLSPGLVGHIRSYLRNALERR